MANPLSDDQFKKEFETLQLQYFSPFFDIEKLGGRIPSFGYLMSELKKLEEACSEKEFQHVYQKKTLLKSMNAKKLCRNGVPLKYMKTFLLKMFHIEFSADDYQTKCDFVLKGRKISTLGTFIPLFTNKSFEESLPVHFLKDEGIEALKEILWLLNSVISIIEYSPILIKLTSLLLIFLSKEETYEVMRTILEINLNPLDIDKIRWHCRFTYNETLKIGSSVHESIFYLADEDINIKLWTLKNLHCPSEKLVYDMSDSFFMNYLNFAALIHFLPFFLYEGTKSIYRMSYAIFKNVNFTVISKVPEPTEKKVISKFMDVSSGLLDIGKLYQDAFAYNLNHKNNKYITQNVGEINDFLNKKNYFYLPTFSPISNIIPDEKLVALWELLPLEVKTFDGKLIYDTKGSPNANLTTLYEICEKQDPSSLIFFVIETDKKDIFGGVMNQNLMLTDDGNWLRPSNAYLYTITPKVNIYRPKSIYDDILLCEPGVLRFGSAPEGAAICIAHDLKSGWSDQDSKYLKEKLTSEDSEEFTIANMEVFLLV